MITLKERFEEMIHLTWGEFIELEGDKSASIDDTVLCSLIRTCAETDDIAAIKLAFDRIDGLQETPIDIKVPKFFTRYVKATEIETGETKALEGVGGDEPIEGITYDPATAKLRATLREMRRMPRDVIRAIRLYKGRIEKGKVVKPEPTVKAIIVANLLKNVTKGRFKAIELVFDQIDGKLTRTISLLGGQDVYVDDFVTLTAPVGAIKDESGFYVAENQVMTTQWIRGFAKSKTGLEALAKGLEDE